MKFSEDMFSSVLNPKLKKIFWKKSKLGTLATIREVKVELPNWD
jgi:hypothetical protein